MSTLVVLLPEIGDALAVVFKRPVTLGVVLGGGGFGPKTGTLLSCFSSVSDS